MINHFMFVTLVLLSSAPFWFRGFRSDDRGFPIAGPNLDLESHLHRQTTTLHTWLCIPLFEQLYKKRMQ